MTEKRCLSMNATFISGITIPGRLIPVERATLWAMGQSFCFRTTWVCTTSSSRTSSGNCTDGIVATPARIHSMDQFRGYTMAGMFLVNFVGAFAVTHPLLKHHNTYNSYADTIMPHFFFAVGFSMRLVMLRNIAQMGDVGVSEGDVPLADARAGGFDCVPPGWGVPQMGATHCARLEWLFRDSILAELRFRRLCISALRRSGFCP